MKRSEFLARIADCHNVRKISPPDFRKWDFSERFDRGAPYLANVGKFALIIDRASFGDYDSSTYVERSNFQVLRKLGISRKLGAYGSCTAYIPHNLRGIKSDDFEEICEIVESLEDYPLADDELHSEMEYAAFLESWESCYYRDFARELRALLNISPWVDLTDYPDWVEIEQAAQNIGLESCLVYTEAGGNVFWDTHEMAVKMPKDTNLAALILWAKGQE